jgi:hypothetical protein
MSVQPGDLIFYVDTGDSWKHSIFSWLQKIGGEMGGLREGPMSFTHVAMISTEPDLIVELKWPRPKFRLFADDMRKKVIMRPKCPNDVKIRAIYWCYFNIDTKYSFLSMLLGKFGLQKAYKVCSGWLDMAYKEAGYSLSKDGDKLVSPNELYSSDKLIKVEG